METQTTKLIEQLAQKLGTTTEYLWSVLIKQAAISATIDLIYLVIVSIGLFVFIKLHLKFSKSNGDRWENTSFYNRHDGAEVAMIFGGMLLSVAFLICFFSIGDIINGFVNPEYWALNKILKVLNN